jgi:hypothetical protein
VAHRVEDAGGQEPVIGGTGKPERLDEVPLSNPMAELVKMGETKAS